MELDRFIRDIEQGIKDIEKEGILLRVFSWFCYSIWKACLSKNYKSFKANKDCINCGICERACPAKNIVIERDTPTWSNKCEDCMACVQHCPQKAIYFNSKTSQKERYRHPEITINELLHKY